MTILPPRLIPRQRGKGAGLKAHMDAFLGEEEGEAAGAEEGVQPRKL